MQSGCLLVRHALVGDTKSSSNVNTVVLKSDGCVAEFLAVLESAMAGIGEWLWLLKARLAPNHRERPTVCVRSTRNCSLSNRSSDRTLLTRLMLEARRPAKDGSHGVWLCLCFVSSRSRGFGTRPAAGIGGFGFGFVLAPVLVGGNELT